LWEKREKIKGFNGITVIYLQTAKDWGIDIANDFFLYDTQARRFLDGLEESP